MFLPANRKQDRTTLPATCHPSVFVNATTNNSFGSEDVYLLDENLPARYRQASSAAWFAHRAIQHDIRQFESSAGDPLFPNVTGGTGSPGQLLGNPMYEMEGMDSSLGTGNDYVLVFGDFQNYVIADRSSSVEFIPHLFSTGNGRPTGQRGWFATFRVGADSVNDGAFRLLNV